MVKKDDAEKIKLQDDVTRDAVTALVNGIMRKYDAATMFMTLEAIYTSVMISFIMSHKSTTKEMSDEEWREALTDVVTLMSDHTIDNVMMVMKRIKEDPNYLAQVEAKIH